MRKRVAVLIVLVVLVAGLASVLLITRQTPAAEADIYAAFLSRGLGGRMEDVLYVVNARTSSVRAEMGYSKFLDSGSSVEKKLAGLTPQASARAVQALAKVGEERVAVGEDLLRAVGRDLKVRIATEAELHRIFSGADLAEAWKQFYATFPKGKALITFSRVGFDDESRQALMLVSVTCGGNCGTGHSVVLERRWNGWHVMQIRQIWSS